MPVAQLPIILSIESSCDDSSVAITQGYKVLSNIVSNQLVHKKYGGVVPELASRDHIKNVLLVVDRALKESKLSFNQIDAFSCTQGPGLIGSLMVGVNTAKSLAQIYKKPLLGVNHLTAHIYSSFLDLKLEELPQDKYLSMVISGGHTQIYRVENRKVESLGKTFDDATGEAFDKIGKTLGLSYPAGAEIDKWAEKGNLLAYKFPIAKIKNYDFSFSGLKTAVLYFVRDQCKNNPNFIEQNMADICASVQHTIVTTLLQKLTKAMKETRNQNSGLRRWGVCQWLFAKITRRVIHQERLAFVFTREKIHDRQRRNDRSSSLSSIFGWKICRYDDDPLCQNPIK